MKTILACAAALAVLTVSPASAETGDPASPYGEEARIPFANHGGIRNFRVVDRETLLIEGRGDRWYRAELFAPCFGLRHSLALGFDTDFSSSFDRFGKIVTRDQTCQVRSLVRIPDPDLPRDAAENDPKAG